MKDSFPKIPKSFFVMWVISLITVLLVLGGGALVVIHFVLKFW